MNSEKTDSKQVPVQDFSNINTNENMLIAIKHMAKQMAESQFTQKRNNINTSIQELNNEINNKNVNKITISHIEEQYQKTDNSEGENVHLGRKLSNIEIDNENIKNRKSIESEEINEEDEIIISNNLKNQKVEAAVKSTSQSKVASGKMSIKGNMNNPIKIDEISDPNKNKFNKEKQQPKISELNNDLKSPVISGSKGSPNMNSNNNQINNKIEIHNLLVSSSNFTDKYKIKKQPDELSQSFSDDLNESSELTEDSFDEIDISSIKADMSQTFYDKNLTILDKKRKHEDHQRALKLKEELKEIKDKPKINEKSRKLIDSKKDYKPIDKRVTDIVNAKKEKELIRKHLQDNNTASMVSSIREPNTLISSFTQQQEFFEAQKFWKLVKDEKVEAQRQEKERKDKIKESTYFYPSINEVSSRLTFDGDLPVFDRLHLHAKVKERRLKKKIKETFPTFKPKTNSSIIVERKHLYDNELYNNKYIIDKRKINENIINQKGIIVNDNQGKLQISNLVNLKKRQSNSMQKQYSKKKDCFTVHAKRLVKRKIDRNGLSKRNKMKSIEKSTNEDEKLQENEYPNHIQKEDNLQLSNNVISIGNARVNPTTQKTKDNYYNNYAENSPNNDSLILKNKASSDQFQNPQIREIAKINNKLNSKILYNLNLLYSKNKSCDPEVYKQKVIDSLMNIDFDKHFINQHNDLNNDINRNNNLNENNEVIDIENFNKNDNNGENKNINNNIFQRINLPFDQRMNIENFNNDDDIQATYLRKKENVNNIIQNYDQNNNNRIEDEKFKTKFNKETPNIFDMEFEDKLDKINNINFFEVYFNKNTNEQTHFPKNKKEFDRELEDNQIDIKKLEFDHDIFKIYQFKPNYTTSQNEITNKKDLQTKKLQDNLYNKVNDYKLKANTEVNNINNKIN